MAMSTIARGIDWIQVHGDLVEHHNLSAEQAHRAEYLLQRDFPHGFQRPADIPEIIELQPSWGTRTAQIALKADGSPALTRQGMLLLLGPNPPRIDRVRIEAWIGNPFPLRVLPQRLAEVAAVVAEIRPPIEPETPVEPPPVELPSLPNDQPTNPRPGEPGWSPLRDGIPPSKAWLERMGSSPELDAQRLAAEQARADARRALADAAALRDAVQQAQLETEAAKAATEKAHDDVGKAESSLGSARQELEAQRLAAEQAQARADRADTDAEASRAEAAERVNAAEQERVRVEQKLEASRQAEADAVERLAVLQGKLEKAATLKGKTQHSNKTHPLTDRIRRAMKAWWKKGNPRERQPTLEYIRGQGKLIAGDDTPRPGCWLGRQGVLRKKWPSESVIDRIFSGSLDT